MDIHIAYTEPALTLPAQIRTIRLLGNETVGTLQQDGCGFPKGFMSCIMLCKVSGFQRQMCKLSLSSTTDVLSMTYV